MSAEAARRSDAWPALPLHEWRDTLDTVHRWMQIVGKIQLSSLPWINHSWHVTLLPSAQGLSTAALPYGQGTFQIHFNFPEDRLEIVTTDGGRGGFPLRRESVASFHRRLTGKLRELGIEVRIHDRPNEVPDPVPFAEDESHASYDAEYVRRFWRILLSCEQVFTRFRARFVGKCSPVHFFWGSADLAVTRFSGRTAPRHPGGIPALPDRVVEEAYSHEVSSAGFWPGSPPIEYPAFYSYAYPEPEGFGDWTVRPADAFYSRDLREFILPYEAVRSAADPASALLEFLQTSYEAAAELASWDRAALERSDDWVSPGPQYSTNSSSG